MTANEYRALATAMRVVKTVIHINDEVYLWIGLSMLEQIPIVYATTQNTGGRLNDDRLTVNELRSLAAVRSAVSYWLEVGDQPLPDLEKIAHAAYAGTA